MNLSIEPNDSVTLKIRHRDDDLLVVDKPARLVTQPGKGHESDSLLNGLFVEFGAKLQNLGRARDFGLLHRLDRQTSGLLVVALTRSAYDSLRDGFERRLIRKFYWAVSVRAPHKPAGTIRRPIVEESGDRKTARIGASGKLALTAYRVIESTDRGAVVECRPVSGRLHQVRLHLHSIGCPIFGDDVYGRPALAAAAPRLALHAHRLAFTHPRTGETVDVRSPFPRDLKPLLRRLGLATPTDRPHQVRGDPVGEEEPGIGEAPSSA